MIQHQSCPLQPWPHAPDVTRVDVAEEHQVQQHHPVTYALHILLSECKPYIIGPPLPL